MIIGQQGQLSGCHNDANNIKRYLIQNEGFQEKDMLILMDDGQHHAPTKKNITDAFHRITQYSRAGDVVFIHYSGHGGRVKDLDGDEDDGYDETLIPVDFKSAGHILDDDIYRDVVKAMPADVNVTVLVRTTIDIVMLTSILISISILIRMSSWCKRWLTRFRSVLLCSALLVWFVRWIVVTVEPPWTCRTWSILPSLRCMRMTSSTLMRS